MIKDNVTLYNKRTHGTTDRVRNSEFPIKINNTTTKELSEEAETRKLISETIGNAYAPPNITEILDQLESAKCLSTFDLAETQKQGSTNLVNTSNIIGKEMASVSRSKPSVKLSEGNSIELGAKSLNCKKDQTTENKSIAIPTPKTESVSRECCYKNSKNNSKSTENIPKRPIQINNNLNIISTSS